MPLRRTFWNRHPSENIGLNDNLATAKMPFVRKSRKGQGGQRRNVPNLKTDCRQRLAGKIDGMNSC